MQKTASTLQSRRFDIDWLRVIALLLLIIYHIVISFQSWAKDAIYFIENIDPLPGLWTPMQWLNIWRIPLLFLISGMGLCFAMQRRSVCKLLIDRSSRILFPAVAGFFLICPLNSLLFQEYYGQELHWIPIPGHLWFLFNIFAYVLLLLPFIVLFKKYPENLLFQLSRRLTEKPQTLLALILPFALEGYLLQPAYYSLFIYTLHGFVLGMLAFFTGFFMICAGDNFWRSVKSLRFITLAGALTLYAVRWFLFGFEKTNNALNGAECMLWILSALGFAAAHINRDSRALRLLSPAVYPIYILHLPVQFAVASLLFPKDISAPLKLILLIVSTFAVCWLLYTIIGRIPLLRPIFGMKYRATGAS